MSDSSLSVAKDATMFEVGDPSATTLAMSITPRVSEEKKEGSQELTEVTEPKSLRFKLTVLFLCGVSVVASMDAVIVGACLPAIASDLNSTSAEAFWVGTSFLLAQTAMIPIYGTTSEIFGRKWVIITAITLFTFGSILCATAKSIDWLIGARVVQGVGAGGMVQLVQVILSDITTMQERGLYIALAAFAWALGSNIGIPIGGAIGTYTSWRWIFWINVPFCVVCELGLIYSLHLQKDTSSFSKKLARIDYLGLFIFTSASTLFLVGVTSGGVSHPWDSAEILAPLIIGALLYMAFVFVEWKIAKEPMMPLRIFNDRTAFTGFATSFLQGLVVWCYTYYMIIFFLGSLEHGLLHAALETLSTGAYTAPAAIFGSILIKRTLKFKYLIVSGWVLLTIGVGVNVTMHPDSSKAIIYGPRCLAALGAGLLFPTPLFAVQAKQRGEDIGIVTSVQVFFRSLGTAFGVGLGGVIFQNQWTKLINERVSAGKIPEAYVLESNLAEVGYDAIKAFPQAVQEEYRWLYSDSLNMVWWSMMGVCVLGFVISLTARNETLRKGLSGSQNFQDKKKRADPENAVSV